LSDNRYGVSNNLKLGNVKIIKLYRLMEGLRNYFRLNIEIASLEQTDYRNWEYSTKLSVRNTFKNINIRSFFIYVNGYLPYILPNFFKNYLRGSDSKYFLTYINIYCNKRIVELRKRPRKNMLLRLQLSVDKLRTYYSDLGNFVIKNLFKSRKYGIFNSRLIKSYRLLVKKFNRVGLKYAGGDAWWYRVDNMFSVSSLVKKVAGLKSRIFTGLTKNNIYYFRFVNFFFSPLFANMKVWGKRQEYRYGKYFKNIFNVVKNKYSFQLQLWYLHTIRWKYLPIRANRFKKIFIRIQKVEFLKFKKQGVFLKVFNKIFEFFYKFLWQAVRRNYNYLNIKVFTKGAYLFGCFNFFLPKKFIYRILNYFYFLGGYRLTLLSWRIKIGKVPYGEKKLVYRSYSFTYFRKKQFYKVEIMKRRRDPSYVIQEYKNSGIVLDNFKEKRVRVVKNGWYAKVKKSKKYS
jgi:hypothetical protein